MRDEPDQSPVRLDQWLWAARLFKTRSLAARAIKAGRIEVNDAKARPSKPVRPGDRVRIRREPGELIVDVAALAARRGSAQAAMALYTETEQSKARRAAQALERSAQAAARPRFKGRPGKRDRRALLRLKHAAAQTPGTESD